MDTKKAEEELIYIFDLSIKLGIKDLINSYSAAEKTTWFMSDSKVPALSEIIDFSDGDAITEKWLNFYLDANEKLGEYVDWKVDNVGLDKEGNPKLLDW